LEGDLPKKAKSWFINICKTKGAAMEEAERQGKPFQVTDVLEDACMQWVGASKKWTQRFELQPEEENALREWLESKKEDFPCFIYGIDTSHSESFWALCNHYCQKGGNYSFTQYSFRKDIAGIHWENLMEAKLEKLQHGQLDPDEAEVEILYEEEEEDWSSIHWRRSLLHQILNSSVA
jgi:hypothetical protein